MNNPNDKPQPKGVINKINYFENLKSINNNAISGIISDPIIYPLEMDVDINNSINNDINNDISDDIDKNEPKIIGGKKKKVVFNDSHNEYIKTGYGNNCYNDLFESDTIDLDPPYVNYDTINRINNKKYKKNNDIIDGYNSNDSHSNNNMEQNEQNEQNEQIQEIPMIFDFTSSFFEENIIILPPLPQLPSLSNLRDSPFKPNKVLKKYPQKNQIQNQNQLNNKHKKFFNCSQCKMVFRNEDNYNEHRRKHLNEIENTICFCNKCGILCANDDEYFAHKKKCENKTENKITHADIIPTDPIGKYACPLCDNKYSNAFILGEHFITSHNDYSVLCDLDKRIHNGFPGFNLLYRINMIKQLSEKKSLDIITKRCEICCIDFSYDSNEIQKSKLSDDILMDNRNPLVLTCCKFIICHDCLMKHVSINDTLICPYCKKDHTRNDLEYVIYIDIVNDTDRTKWIPWWENHLDIFISNYNIS